MFRETPIKSDEESEVSFLKRCFEKWDELLFSYEIERVEKFLGNKYVVHMTNGVEIRPGFGFLSFTFNNVTHNINAFEKLKSKLVYLINKDFDINIKY